MAIKITEECINCGACEPECPNTAIYEGGGHGNYQAKLMVMVMLHPRVQMVSSLNDFFYIVPDKCTECVGFHDEPQCAAVFQLIAASQILTM